MNALGRPKHVFTAGLLALAAAAAAAAQPPAPFGATPSARQLAWHELEFYGFTHYTVNAFTNREWGSGGEKPAIFNPSELDAEQWVRAAKSAGMKGLILTAKHHDGFCLWPSKYTEHSVKNCPWKGGKGDVVGELSAACRKHGLKFGFYLSPWDRNHAEYGRPAYIKYFRNQLRELLTGYGPVFEVWFDGANGGSGYYGGANETRRIDGKTYYDWDNTWKIVRELQPGAVMFSDGGPDVRWVGNEAGRGYDPNWATLTRAGLYPGISVRKNLNHGVEGGKDWLPAECDVSIRRGWFFHPDQEPKSLETLVGIYYDSVGRGCNLLLNITPDRRGLIPEPDVRRLAEFGRYLRETFRTDLARGGRASASSTRGGDTFGASKLTDGDRATYWAAPDGVREASLTVELGEPKTFDVVRVQEHIALGQRIASFAVDVRENAKWRQAAAGQTIGPRRLLRLAKKVPADAVRLRILKSLACPTIDTIELYASAPVKK